MVDYLSPQTITDVVADGIFAQAEYDSDFNSNLGSIAHVDVESAGDSFVVHFKPTFGSIFTANAEQVAVLNSAQGMLHWTSPRASCASRRTPSCARRTSTTSACISLPWSRPR